MMDEESILQSAEYKAIAKYYGLRTALRSKVPLINHINEGIKIICDWYGEYNEEVDEACKAFCLHPLLQNDEDMLQNLDAVILITTPKILALTLEYRLRANAWLSAKVSKAEDGSFELDGYPLYGRFRQVKAMLVADKVQNCKDFELYHKGTHPRSEALGVYFKTWLEVLGVGTAAKPQA